MRMRIVGMALLMATSIAFAARACEARQASSENTTSGIKSAESLPQPLKTALAAAKKKTHIPIFLPSELPPSVEARGAIVDRAEANEYAISIYSQLGTGNGGFVALFAGEDHPQYGPGDLPNVQEVKLARGIAGFFRSVSCGGSCAPANIWWEVNGVLYQIQLSLSPNVSEEDQENSISSLANSCILAGPR